MIICPCRNVSESKVLKALSNGCDTVEKLKRATGVTAYCGVCMDAVEEMLEDFDFSSKKLISA